ncbi:hypothetical protein ACFFUB_12395 [Algimonas porphyrae]|uniref:Uncharacterized protein n=1 Tax=Algimonas porphyrae TaxID=1128113 RepID=A0ABQ5UWD0_9PROT|nr:hypothetical protein [Algimonas porphyrae]GLQ19209.1 hypothetical protein GCM10007854_01640 [Algimonas porphyrae]
MTSTLIENLEQAAQIAKEGRASPLLGGEIGLTWTILATIALMAHGAIISGWTPLNPNFVGLVWLVYGVTGLLITAILARRLNNMSSASCTLTNQASRATWVSSGHVIVVVVMSIIVAINVNDYSFDLFNVIVPLAFSLATLSYAVLAKLTGQGYLRFAAILSGSAASVTLMIIHEPHMYFVAGILLFISGVIPSVIEIRKAQTA